MTIATKTSRILAKILLATVGIGSVVIGVISTPKPAEAGWGAAVKAASDFVIDNANGIRSQVIGRHFDQIHVKEYDYEALKQRYGGDAFQVAGDWCNGEVAKQHHVKDPIAGIDSTVRKQGSKIDCFYRKPIF